MLVESSCVAGVEPSVRVYDLLGSLWVFVVTHHHVVSLAADFVVLWRDFYLHARQRRTYRAGFSCHRPFLRHGYHRRSLAHAVSLEDWPSHGVEEVGQHRVDARAAAHDDVKIAAKCGSPFLVNKCVGNLVLYFICNGLFVKVVAFGYIYCPVVYVFAKSFKILACAYEFFLNFLQKPWHTRHHLRIHFLQVFHDGRHVLGVVCCRAYVLIQVNHHSFVNVAQRQETECFFHSLVWNILEVQQLVDEVAVAEHHALRQSGRS